jgi:hypothetical protein
MEPQAIKTALQQHIFAHAQTQHFNSYSKAVFHKLSVCHTAKMGLHQYRCDNKACAHMHHQYHSCGNRHCPHCGVLKRERWISQRLDELVPTTYYHMVFTLPAPLHGLVLGNRKVLLSLLFDAVHYTLNKLGKDTKYLGAKPGVLSVLHTWGQQLTFHPHVHCIVTGGGLNSEGKWVKEKRSNGNFLFPRRAMEKIYKGYFLEHVAQLVDENKLNIEHHQALQQIIASVQCIKWNVYAKRPFAGPETVIKYLANYTHKTAITTRRITHISDTHISFRYKDYADGNKQKLLTLTHDEFLRRFEQHILPQRFVRIRHAGFMAHQHKEQRLANITTQLALPPRPAPVQVSTATLALLRFGTDITQCPRCKQGKLQLVATYIYYNGSLVNIQELNKGSPYKSKSLCKTKN